MESVFASDISLHTSSEDIPDIPCATVDIMGADGTPMPYEMEDFWDGCRLWLSKRGIDLYDLRQPKDSPPYGRHPKNWYTPITSTIASLPYATCAHKGDVASKPIDTAIRLAPARDASNRDVMLKLVDKGSHQYRIWEELLKHDLFSSPASFPYVLPPLALLDTPHQYSIVSMPMWGSDIDMCVRDMQSVRECLRFMECLIQGLVFLHDRRIAHRDICELNIVVNCYRVDQDLQAYEADLRVHRSGGDVFYALMDYDQSIQLPADVSLRDCRRPASEAGFGAGYYKPPDVSLGESEYNPFAFDVGILGNMFRFYFMDIVPLVPSLAALFDRMTTPVMSSRFTAEEALQFFYATTAQLPDDSLKAHVVLNPSFHNIYDPDLSWSKLSQGQQLIWSKHRTPQPSWWIYVLDWVTRFPVGHRIIAFVRRVLRI